MMQSKLTKTRPCRSCPFTGVEAAKLAPGRLEELVSMLLENPGFRHLCHSDLSEQTFCAGAADIQEGWTQRRRKS